MHDPLAGTRLDVAEARPGRPPSGGFVEAPEPVHTSALGRARLAFTPTAVVVAPPARLPPPAVRWRSGPTAVDEGRNRDDRGDCRAAATSSDRIRTSFRSCPIFRQRQG